MQRSRKKKKKKKRKYELRSDVKGICMRAIYSKQGRKITGRGWWLSSERVTWGSSWRDEFSGFHWKMWSDCESPLTGPPLLDSAKFGYLWKLCVNMVGWFYSESKLSTTAGRHTHTHTHTHTRTSLSEMLRVDYLDQDVQEQTWITYFCLC